jgi:hypothetical protein
VPRLRSDNRFHRGEPLTSPDGRAPPKKCDDKTAAQPSKPRRRKILDRWVLAGQEVLEVFQDASIHPKASDDPRDTSPRAVACHRDRCRPGVGDKCSISPGRPVRVISTAGNSDKTARRMTQHQVRTRSDVPAPSHAREKHACRITQLPPHAWPLAGSPLKRARKQGVLSPTAALSLSHTCRASPSSPPRSRARAYCRAAEHQRRSFLRYGPEKRCVNAIPGMRGVVPLAGPESTNYDLDIRWLPRAHGHFAAADTYPPSLTQRQLKFAKSLH